MGSGELRRSFVGQKFAPIETKTKMDRTHLRHGASDAADAADAADNKRGGDAAPSTRATAPAVASAIGPGRSVAAEACAPTP